MNPSGNPSSQKVLEELDFELHDRKGPDWADAEKHGLSKELREFASACLSPMPDYNCLSSDYSTAFDDRLLVIARSITTRRIVGFTSAVFLTMGFQKHDNDKSKNVDYEDNDIPFVLHTGLTCVATSHRQKNLTIFLFYHIFLHMVSEYLQGFWLSNLASVLSSLGSIARYATNVYPSPSMSEPAPTHSRIAETISRHHRPAMQISPRAAFDADRFVFRDSNEDGSCFLKDVNDKRYAYRQDAINRYYRQLLRKGSGDEVLQVAFVDPRILLNTSESRFDRLQGRSRDNKL
jgi:hypothetical protein